MLLQYVIYIYKITIRILANITVKQFSIYKNEGINILHMALKEHW